MEKGLSEKEAAVFYHVHRQTIANWRFQGKGPAYHKIGRKVVYYEKDLREYLARGRVDPEEA